MTLKHTSFCFHITGLIFFVFPKQETLRTPSYMKGENPWLCCLRKWDIDSILFFSQLNIIQIYSRLSVCFKYPALFSSFLTTDLWTTLTDKEKVRRWPLNNGHLQSSKLGTFPEQRDFPEREFPHLPTSCFVDYGTGLMNYFCRDSV